MTTVYKDMNADIKAFPVFRLTDDGKLIPAPDIVDVHCYNHTFSQLHHYVKAQSYKSRMQWYLDNGIEQKLILMRTITHQHLENPVYELPDDLFIKKYKVSKDLLLFNKRKWLEKQTKGENYDET